MSTVVDGTNNSEVDATKFDEIVDTISRGATPLAHPETADRLRDRLPNIVAHNLLEPGVLCAIDWRVFRDFEHPMIDFRGTTKKFSEG